MDPDLVHFAVNYGQERGAEYVEARLHENKHLTGLLRNGIAEPPVVLDSRGLGVRVLCQGVLAFGATNLLTRSRVKATVGRLVKEARAVPDRAVKKIRFSDDKLGVSNWKSVEQESLDDVSVGDMLAVLREADHRIAGEHKGVSFRNRLLTLAAMVEKKVFASSGGADLQSRVTRVSFMGYSTAAYDGKSTTVTFPPGYQQLGRSGGWEVVKQLRLLEILPQLVESYVESIKCYERPPEGEVDVVLGGDVAGLVAHESVGHPGEADRVLGREAAQAGESYLIPNDLGRRIGSREANVSDDPTLDSSMGFYMYDDEGVPARKRRLLDEGVVGELLHNRATASEFGLKSNGSSRSLQFDKEPIVRMANTFVEPGDFSRLELIEDIRLGVLIDSFMEWNIDDKRLNQRYVGLEAHLIEKGEIKRRVKNPVLEITTPRFWGSVDARAREIKFTAATCGKGDPSQPIPVWTGGPDIRLRNVRIGAR